MSHPCRMLTDRELRNFARFIRPNPQGAFDSALSKPAHIRRLRTGVDIREFGPGGAYDSSPENLEGAVRAALVQLARDLSVEEWAALKNSLCNEGEGAEAEDNDLPDEKRQATAMDAFARSGLGQIASRVQQDRYPRDNRPAPRTSAEGAASFAALFPGAVAVRTV